MEFDVSIWVLLKVALIAVGTYVLLPLFLVIRDFLLWQIIDHFIITSELKHQISLYSEWLFQWNTKFAGKVSIEHSESKTKYFINEKQVEQYDWEKFRTERDSLQEAMNKSLLYIHRRSNLVTWLLKHYKQDSSNPIKKMYEESNLRVKEQYEETRS